MVKRESVLDFGDLGKRDLSLSDYFSTDVPYEVKPVPSTIPMEETESDYVGHSDIPTQSKDLFKGLWEDIVHNSVDYWMDKEGRFLKAPLGHIDWAKEWLMARRIEFDPNDSWELYELMFKRQLIRVKVRNNEIYFEYSQQYPPNNIQWRNLKDTAIESRMKLIDGSGSNGKSRQEIDLLQESSRILVKGTKYWLDPKGNWEDASIDGSHAAWANKHDMPDVSLGRLEPAFKNGYIRVLIDDQDMMVIEYSKEKPPSNLQWRVLIDSAIETGVILYDSTMGKVVREPEPLREEKLPVHAWYWLDPKGKLIPMEKMLKKFGTRYMEMPDTYEWAQRFLAANGIQSDDNDAMDKMFELHYVLVFAAGGIINYEYGNYKPNQSQMATLVKDSKDSQYHLYDKTKHHVVRQDDTSLGENNDNRQLFIESMMPDDTNTFKSHLAQLFAYLQKELQLKSVPKVKLMSDEKNASKVLGKTAYYDPATRTVVLFTTDRHQKDILRSFSHEVIHHWQHENEKLQTSNTKKGESDPQYAQNNPWLRQMEKQAYLLGNILFRDWEDEKKAKDRKSQKKMVEKTMLIGRGYPPKRPNYRG